jgi:hypothetical protein
MIFPKPLTCHRKNLIFGFGTIKKLIKTGVFHFLIPVFGKEALVLTLRSKQLFFTCILSMVMVAIIPLAAQASDYGAQDLTLGSRGSAVTLLQKDLSGLGFYSNSIDGWFGPKTYDAVISFQKSQGLKGMG